MAGNALTTFGAAGGPGPIIPVTLVANDQASGRIGMALGRIQGHLKRTAIMLASFRIFQRTFQALTANLVEFEEGMATVSTFIDTSKVNMEAMADMAILLRANTIFTFKQITDAMAEAVQRGVDVSEMYQFLLQTSKAATAGNAELVDIVNVTTSAWAAYGKELGNTTKIQDAFFATQDVGNLKMVELSQELGRVMPIAAMAGVRFEEVLAGIAAITRSGMPVTEAVTRLTRVLTVVAKASDRTKKEFQKLGIDFSTAGMRAKGLKMFIDDLMKAVDGNIDMLARLIPEIRSFQGVVILGGKGAEIYAHALDKIADSAGRTELEHGKRMKSLVKQWQRFQGAVSAIMVQFGRHAAPVISEMLAEWTGKLVAWLIENKDQIKVYARAWATAFAGTFRAIGHVLSTLSKLSGPIFFNLQRGILVIVVVFESLAIVAVNASNGILGIAWALGRLINFISTDALNAFAKMDRWLLRLIGLGDLIVNEDDVGNLVNVDWIGPTIEKNVDRINELREAGKKTIKTIHEMTEEGGMFGEKLSSKTATWMENLLSVLDHFAQRMEESFTKAGKTGFWGGMSKGIGDFIKDVEDAFKQGDEAGKAFAEGLTNSFQQLFFSPFDENIKSVGEAFKQFGKSILDTFGRILSEMFAKQAVAGLLKLVGFVATGTDTSGGIKGTLLGGEARGRSSVRTGNRLMHAMGKTKDVLGQARGHPRFGVKGSPELVVRGEGSKFEAVVPLPDNRSIPVKFKGEPQASEGQIATILLAPDVILDRGIRANGQMVRQLQALPYRAMNVEQYRIMTGRR